MCGGRQDLNRPRIYLALPQSSPPYNKAQFFDKGRISPCLFRTFLIAVCAFTRCILTHTENFTPHPPGPKPGVQLFEPMRAIWLFASFWLIHSPFYKTHLLNIFSEIKNRINCCLCLKVSLKNGSISRYILEQWASESFQCLPFPYTRRICMNFTTNWCGSELTWQVCSMLFASLLQDAFFIIRSLALRPCLLTKNRCYYVANDSLILLSASLLQ